MERVARALDIERFDDLPPGHGPGECQECDYMRNEARRQARAAITAMREPTTEMRKVCSFETAEVEYPAMIDAALK